MFGGGGGGGGSGGAGGLRSRAASGVWGGFADRGAQVGSWKERVAKMASDFAGVQQVANGPDLRNAQAKMPFIYSADASFKESDQQLGQEATYTSSL